MVKSEESNCMPLMAIVELKGIPRMRRAIKKIKKVTVGVIMARRC